MENKELDELLHQLHDEIQKKRSIDDKGSELLRDLEVDIRTLLERSQAAALQVHPSIVQRLELAVNQLEVTYPDLTTLISNLLDSLSSAGI
jgi:arsenate reductase-like glutaredoxin family protein